MKRSDLIFEAYLLLITVLIGIEWIMHEEDGPFIYVAWAIMLALFQLGHSIVMRISYPKNDRLKNSLTLYWAFTPLAIFPWTGIFLSIPVAIYFWLSTWRHWRLTQKQ